MPFELLLTEPHSIAGSSARPGALARNQVRAGAIVSDISDHVAAFGAETSSKPWLNFEITAVPTTRVGADRRPRRLPTPSVVAVAGPAGPEMELPVELPRRREEASLGLNGDRNAAEVQRRRGRLVPPARSASA